MADPSSSVSPQLLHHLHALCIMKYPQHQTLQPELLVDMLLKTPQIVQQYPFTWMMIDPPQPGTLMLSWHPPQMPGVCASDGYVWADAELSHNVEVKGYPIEIYYHKAGYNPNVKNQTHTLFSRRRYRLKPGHPSTPPETANLWILHYIQADRPNQVPINNLITSSVHQSFTARNYIAQLFQTGQLPRKEFFLHDRNSWPMITLPNQQPQQHPPQQQQQQQQQIMQAQQAAMQMQTPQHSRQISPLNARATPQPPQAAGVQQMYYTPARAAAKAPGGAPPSAKRLKPTPPGSHNQAAAAAQAAALGVDASMTIDEEEDTSRGDILDHLSPREIATTRYIQHHEWMEEVMGSPYAIDKIEPVDLGLGLRGDLESVTKGLLDPPVYPYNSKPRAGEAPKGKEKSQTEILEELRSRVEAKIREMEADMLRMQDAHARRLRKIKQSGVTKDAELSLRVGLGLMAQETSENETPVPSPDREVEGESMEMADVKDIAAVEEIVREVERVLGKQVVEKKMLVKHDLPVEEILKMGGVVAEGGGQPNADTVMGEETDGDAQLNGHGNGIDLAATTVEDEFNLAIGNLPDEATDNSSHLSEMGFPHPPDSSDATEVAPPAPPAEEDTIMDDFMNVDQDSKPDTPNTEEKKGKEPTPPKAEQKASEDAATPFRFSPPTEKVVDESGGSSSGILGSGLADGK